MSAERIVIVAYKPFQGKEAELNALIKTHVAVLRSEGLASDRKPAFLKAKHNTIIEIFGWKSKEAIESAHSNAAVQKMWEQFAQVCEFIPLKHVAEASDMFAEFDALK
jgi:hypothetical protein